MKKQKVIYVCSKYKGNVEKNTEQAIEYCRAVYKEGFIPIAPHLYLPRFLNDNDPIERKQALELGLQALKHCDEIWVFDSDISSGMQMEIDFAEKHHIPITYVHGELYLMKKNLEKQLEVIEEMHRLRDILQNRFDEQRVAFTAYGTLTEIKNGDKKCR